jgi:hypothetical protein
MNNQEQFDNFRKKLFDKLISEEFKVYRNHFYISGYDCVKWYLKDISLKEFQNSVDPKNSIRQIPIVIFYLSGYESEIDKFLSVLFNYNLIVKNKCGNKISVLWENNNYINIYLIDQFPFITSYDEKKIPEYCIYDTVENLSQWIVDFPKSNKDEIIDIIRNKLGTFKNINFHSVVAKIKQRFDSGIVKKISLNIVKVDYNCVVCLDNNIFYILNNNLEVIYLIKNDVFVLGEQFKIYSWKEGENTFIKIYFKIKDQSKLRIINCVVRTNSVVHMSLDIDVGQNIYINQILLNKNNDVFIIGLDKFSVINLSGSENYIIPDISSSLAVVNDNSTISFLFEYENNRAIKLLNIINKNKKIEKVFTEDSLSDKKILLKNNIVLTLTFVKNDYCQVIKYDLNEEKVVPNKILKINCKNLSKDDLNSVNYNIETDTITLCFNKEYIIARKINNQQVMCHIENKEFVLGYCFNENNIIYFIETRKIDKKFIKKFYFVKLDYLVNVLENMNNFQVYDVIERFKLKNRVEEKESIENIFGKLSIGRIEQNKSIQPSYGAKHELELLDEEDVDENEYLNPVKKEKKINKF